MEIREATVADWPKLYTFYTQIYRARHPLQTREFWEWQYNDRKNGVSFICINSDNKIIGHVGANFQGGIAWVINAYLVSDYRGHGLLREIFTRMRRYFPLGATSTNDDSLRLFSNMGWIRHSDLVRYVKVNPAYEGKSLTDLCSPVSVSVNDMILQDTHYFQQPSLKGIVLKDGSRAVSQENVGGLRVVSIESIEELELEAWKINYRWMDYLTSANDSVIEKLRSQSWVVDNQTPIPWRLNPIEEGRYATLSFLTEVPLPDNFVVKRYYADHGRIGSL